MIAHDLSYLAYYRLARGMLHEDRIVLALLLAKIYLKGFVSASSAESPAFNIEGDFRSLISSYSSALVTKGRTIRLPASMVDQLYRLRQAQQSLSQQLGRDPNLEELAAATGLKSLDIREVLFRAQEPLSLEGQQNSQSELSLLNSLACDVSKPLEHLDATLIQEDIHQLLDELPAQEAELLRLRYGIAAGEALSLSATARQMGITRDTARGLERRANASIRRLSTRYLDHLEA